MSSGIKASGGINRLLLYITRGIYTGRAPSVNDWVDEMLLRFPLIPGLKGFRSIPFRAARHAEVGNKTPNDTVPCRDPHP